MHVVERSATIDADRDRVWERVTAAEGINDELAPVLAMTMPPGLRDRTVSADLAGQRFGKSWIRLFGVVPVDYDDMAIAAIEPASRFHEVSSMLTFSHWEHERVLTDAGNDRTNVSDRLTFLVRAPLGRVGAVSSLARWSIDRLFAHRHRRLARHFAGPDGR